MAIELNINKVATAVTGDSKLTEEQGAAQGKKLGSLLGGEGVKVTLGGVSDLEALVARLKNEQEKTKFSLLVSSLNSVSESLTAAQKAAVEEGLKLNDQLRALDRQLSGLVLELQRLEADVALLNEKIKALTKQIEEAVKDGEQHRKLMAQLKEQRKELEAKEDTIAATKGKINEAKNEISAVEGKLAAVVKSIGNETLKTIANEIAAISETEEVESNAEQEKKAAKAVANDPFNAIRESLDRLGRELTDTIERSTEVMV